MKMFIKGSMLALVAIFAIANTAVFASEVEEEVANGLPQFTGEGVEETEETAQTDEVDADLPVIGTFMSVTGEVSEIDELIYGESRITLVNPEGEPIAHISTDYFTHVLGNEIAVGDIVTAYYPSNAIMTMIWPPQHTARLIVNGDFVNVAIDIFNLTDGNLISANEMLQLNFTENTQILLQDGQDFRAAIEVDEELGIETTLLQEMDGRTLVVTYGPTTMSIPAQTIPGADGTNLSIIVLFEPITAGPAPIDVEPIVTEPVEEDEFQQAVTLPALVPTPREDLPLDIPANAIFVNGAIISAPWQEQNGVYMVPLRSVMAALNLDGTISWNGETNSIVVSNGSQEINLSVGSNEYLVDGQVLTLDSSPVIIDSLTFVPFNFFSLVFGLNNAYYLDGRIMIDNDAPVQLN